MGANYGFFDSSLISPIYAFTHVYYYFFSVDFYVLDRLTGPRELNYSQLLSDVRHRTRCFISIYILPNILYQTP